MKQFCNSIRAILFPRKNSQNHKNCNTTDTNGTQVRFTIFGLYEGGTFANSHLGLFEPEDFYILAK